MDCVYRNQTIGWCGQTTGPQGGCYPSGMTGYPLAMAYIPWQQWKTPYDPAALDYYHQAVRARENAMKAYATTCGPLNFDQVTSENNWNWINSAWPWEGGICTCGNMKNACSTR